MKKQVLMGLVLGMLSIPALAEETSKGTETKAQATEIEALGPTRAVSSIMQGLGRRGTETHKVLFIEVLEENYDTFLPGLMWRRKWVEPYFKFDKEKKKMVIDGFYSPHILNAQKKIRENISLVVKHTLNYKGIGRRYPRCYIYEISQIPTTINLTTIEALYEEQIRFVDNFKIIDLSLDGKVKFIYDKEKMWLKPGDLWKAEKRSEIIPIESDKYIKEQFDWIGMDDNKINNWLKVREERPFGKGISEDDLEALRARKVTFSTEVTIFNHGIVEIDTYRRGSK